MGHRSACLGVWGLQAWGRKGQTGIKIGTEEVQTIFYALPGFHFVAPVAFHDYCASGLACGKALSLNQRPLRHPTAL